MVTHGAGARVHVDVQRTAATPLVVVSGELDLSGADHVRAALADLDDGVERVDLELTRLEFLDSSGLAVFIELASRVQVEIVGASEPVRRIVEVTGLADVLGLGS